MKHYMYSVAKPCPVEPTFSFPSVYELVDPITLFFWRILDLIVPIYLSHLSLSLFSLGQSWQCITGSARKEGERKSFYREGKALSLALPALPLFRYSLHPPRALCQIHLNFPLSLSFPSLSSS